MLKTAQLRYNGVGYGLRNAGSGWDVILGDDIIAENIPTAGEAKEFCKNDSLDSRHNEYRREPYLNFSEDSFNKNCGPKD